MNISENRFNSLLDVSRVHLRAPRGPLEKGLQQSGNRLAIKQPSHTNSVDTVTLT